MSEMEKPEVKEKKRGGGWISALVGFTAGAVVGAVTALLYAPQSGAETRGKIKERFNDLSEKAGDIIERSKESIEEAKDKMAAAYEQAVERTSSVIEQAKEKLGRKKEEV